MRIIVHAGLHKSGTTSLQSSWGAAYGDHPDVWYPLRERGGPPGHHDLVRPHLRAFTGGADPDLVAAGLAWSLRGRRGTTLADVLGEARSRGVGTLLLSSEDLDRVRAEDRDGLASLFAGEDVTLVVTATRPVHRWCSGWQTLVKHGLPAYPREAAPFLLEFSAVRKGRLRELVGLLPGRRRVVRLVRTAPPEPELPAAVAEWLALPDADRAAGQPMLNTSLGADTEVVLRLNRADLALGTDREGRRLLTELRGEGFAVRDNADLAARYEVPEALIRGAEAEASWLRVGAAADGVEVVDPHHALDDWLDPTVPGWYDAVSRREAVVPLLDDAETERAGEEPSLRLWRARQQRSAYRRRLERLQERLQERGGAP